MTLWWTANLPGAQRGTADWLNANSPPGENSDNNGSVCVRVFLYFFFVCFLYLHSSISEFLGGVNHTSMWPAVLQTRHFVHPTLQVCPPSIIPTHSYRWNPVSIFLIDWIETFCCQITSLNNPLAPLFLLHTGLFFFTPPPPWLFPSLFSISSFRFLTKARSGRHMISLPLIGIRFTGLDQHRAGWSQSIAHICTASGSLGTGVRRAVWPATSFFSQSSACHHAQCSGPDELRAHTCMTAFMCEPNSDQRTSILTPFMVC